MEGTLFEKLRKIEALHSCTLQAGTKIGGEVANARQRGARQSGSSRVLRSFRAENKTSFFSTYPFGQFPLCTAFRTEFTETQVRPSSPQQQRGNGCRRPGRVRNVHS